MKDFADTEIDLGNDQYVGTPAECPICKEKDGPSWQVDQVFTLPPEEAGVGALGAVLMKAAGQAVDQMKVFLQHMLDAHGDEAFVDGFVRGKGE